MVAGSPGFDLGTATGRIILDASGVGAGVREAQNLFRAGLEDISGQVRGLGRVMSEVGGSLTLLTSPLSGLGIAGLKAATSFDSAMREISARTGIVGEDLQAISNFALQMGADTVFSSQQAADAFLQLLSSGQSAEQAMATLPAVLNLAAASGDDLGRTADVVTDIMAAYGLAIDQAGSVTDSLARAAASSSADVGSLGQGFANVGGVARQFGLDVDQTAAILGIFAERGIKGAEAGTQLKSMLLNMTRDTPEVRAAWAELGTSMFDAEGNMRDISVVMEEIRVAMANMSPEEQTRLMTDLGGSYGFLGLQALTAGMSIEEMQAAMAGQVDAATVAQMQMQSFQNQINSLMGSFEALEITVLTPFINDVLKPLLEQAILIVNKITEWAKENPELAATITKVLAVAAVLGPVLVIVGAALQAIAPLIALAGAVIGFLLTPVGLLIAGVVLLAAAWATNWNGIRDKTLEIIDTNIKPALEDLKSKLAEIAPDVETLKTNIQNAIGGVTGLDFEGLKTEISTGLTTAITDIQSGTIDLTPVTTWANDNAQAVLDTVVSVVGIVLGGPIGATIGAAKLLATAIENDFLGFGTFIEESGIGAAIQGGVDTLRGILEGAFQGLLGGGGGEDTGAALAEEFASGMAVQGEQSPILTTIQNLITGLKTALSGFTPELQESFTQIGNGISGFIEKLAGADTSGLDDLFATILTIAGHVAGIAGAIIGVGIDIVTDVFENVFPKLGSAIAIFIGILSAIGEGDASAVIQGIADAIGNMISALLGAVAGFADPLITAINTLTGTDLPTLTVLFDMARDALQGVWDKVVEAVGPILEEMQKVVNWFLSEEGGLAGVVKWINETFIAAIAAVQSVLIGLWDAVKGPLETFKTEIEKVFKWVKDNVIDPVAEAIQNVVNAINSLSGYQLPEFAAETAPTAPGQPIQPRDSGGRGYAGTPYLIGRGAQPELFVPGANGTFIPNADRMMGNQYQISVVMPEAALANPMDARRIGQEFGQAILDEIDSL